jgi:hypothetical protein
MLVLPTIESAAQERGTVKEKRRCMTESCIKWPIESDSRLSFYYFYWKWQHSGAVYFFDSISGCQIMYSTTVVTRGSLL